ncbi:MAG: methyltransferase domain-containing protein [Pseudomonadota bacterium]
MEPYPIHARRLPSSADFSQHAFIVKRTADELASRLELLAIEPTAIADIGAHDGALSQQLAAHFPAAQVTAVEPLQALLTPLSSHKPRWPWQRSRIQSAYNPLTALQQADNSVQLAVSNLALPRYAEPDAVLSEAARIVAPGGAFMLSTLGPESLRELRDAWHAVDPDSAHVATFTDMHDVGDALVRHGFAEPVLDVERLTIHYSDPAALWRDLTATLARNVLPDRRNSLTGRQRFARMLHKLTRGDSFDITLEIVYAQCWGNPRTQRSAGTDEVRISPTSIRRRV